jgi:hypothetical protein
MNKANRAAILAFVDAERTRITRNGEVHAYGVIPNTNQTGWYFAGFADDVLDQIAYRAL